MNKLLVYLASLAFLTPAVAVTLAPTVEISQPAIALKYSSSAFDRATDTLPAWYEGHDAVALYTAISQLKENEPVTTPVIGKLTPQDSLFAFTVDLGNAPGNWVQGYNGKKHSLELRYIMTGNQVTEGWNWANNADPKTTDYYRYKYLPLKNLTIEKQAGDIWKYEYMVTFPNLYDFYPRTTDDNAGFVAQAPMTQSEAFKLLGGENLRMLALCRLAPPWHAQSGTFWKATESALYDYTLKKSYLYAELLEIWFYDYPGGKVLAKIKPLPKLLQK